MRDPEYRLMSNVLHHVRVSPLMVSIEGQHALDSFYDDEAGDMTLERIEATLARNEYASLTAFCHDVSTMVSQRLETSSTTVGAVMVKYERGIYAACDVRNPNDRKHLETMIVTHDILNRSGRRRIMPRVDSNIRAAIVQTARSKLAELNRVDGTYDVVKKIFKLKSEDPDALNEQTPNDADLFDLASVLAPHLADDVVDYMVGQWRDLKMVPRLTATTSRLTATTSRLGMERESDDDFFDE
jgi:hypothetical protein